MAKAIVILPYVALVGLTLVVCGVLYREPYASVTLTIFGFFCLLIAYVLDYKENHD